MISSQEQEIFVLEFSRSGIISEWDDVLAFAFYLGLSHSEVSLIITNCNKVLKSVISEILFKVHGSGKKFFFSKLCYAISKCEAKGYYYDFLREYGLTVNGEKCVENPQVKQDRNKTELAILNLSKKLYLDMESVSNLAGNCSTWYDYSSSKQFLFYVLIKKLKCHGLQDFPHYLEAAMNDIGQLKKFNDVVKNDSSLKILVKE